MKTHKLTAEIRSEKGKNACNRLRQDDFIPAIMYSHGKAESIKVPRKEFTRLFKGHISESVLIDLAVSGNKDNDQTKVIVKDYQLDPVTDEVLHLDFYKITMGERLNTMVPLYFTGTSKGERIGGIMEVIERELEIECLPAELPEKIEIDVTNLDLGHSIHIRDLPVSGSLRFVADPGRVVVTVVAPKAVKETVDVEVEEGEAEAAAEQKTESEE